jgi:hypothetical protein
MDFFFQEKGNRNWAIGVGEIFLSAKAKVSFYIWVVDIGYK